MARTLTLADGQLGTTAAAILSGGSAPPGGHVDVICQNTSSEEQTVVLTFQRSGGTARRIWRAVLAENEQLLVGGIPLQPDDTLLAVTTTASAVDYLVFASGASGLSLDVLSADGTSKGVATLRKILLGMELLSDGHMIDPG